MKSPIANRWTPFGLERDPFFQNELSATDEALYPATSYFVGRGAELERVATTVGSGASSCTAIEGDAGVGKTSFVNTLKARLAAGGALTHENPIRLFDDTTFHGLVTEVLRTLLEIRATQLETGVDRFQKVPAKTEQLWEKVATIAEGVTRRGGSVGVAGFSVGTNVSTVSPQGTGDRYFDEVQRALADLSDRGRVPVLLHVDNLENLRDADLAQAAILIRNLRDYLLIPGGHWVFVGKTGVTQDVFEAREEVGSITAQPVSLDPLSPDDVRTLLEVRYQRLRRGRHFTPPVELPVAQAFYNRFYGDLRSFLQLLSRAAERALPADGKTPMTEAPGSPSSSNGAPAPTTHALRCGMARILPVLGARTIVIAASWLTAASSAGRACAASASAMPRCAPAVDSSARRLATVSEASSRSRSAIAPAATSCRARDSSRTA